MTNPTDDPDSPDHQPPSGRPPSWGPPLYSPSSEPSPPPPASGLYVAAAVVNWVVFGLLALVTCGFSLLAGAWFVPMTIFIHKGARDGRKHTALAICTLIFCNIVSGILMLVEDGNRPE